MQIVLERGRLLTLTIDGQTREVWTTATTLEEALRSWVRTRRVQALRRPFPADPAGRAGVSADTLRTATVTVDGASPQVSSPPDCR